MNGEQVVDAALCVGVNPREEGVVATPNGRILVVDDDSQILRVIRRVLEADGRQVTTVGDAKAALAALEAGGTDVVIADLRLPGTSGLELASAVRSRDPDLPVILLTGDASLDSAMRAVELHVFRYLTKPVEPVELNRVVDEAVHTRELALTRQGGDREALRDAFSRTIVSFHMAYQPLVEVATRKTFGYEALIRSREPSLPHPGAVLEAAEKLGLLHQLGRATRAKIAATIAGPCDAEKVFVNLHSSDLADAELYDEHGPLAQHASRVVLEITERASLEAVPDVSARVERLRALGYTIAVDDLGAGYAGLNYFASLRPEIVKIDMSLVRGVNQDPVRGRVVQSLIDLSRGLGMSVVAEGVETIAERDALVAMGCSYLQGYLLARPGPPFPLASWPTV